MPEPRPPNPGSSTCCAEKPTLHRAQPDEGEVPVVLIKSWPAANMSAALKAERDLGPQKQWREEAEISKPVSSKALCFWTGMEEKTSSNILEYYKVGLSS